jgi:hypothetical protein
MYLFGTGLMLVVYLEFVLWHFLFNASEVCGSSLAVVVEADKIVQSTFFFSFFSPFLLT